jgi:hypothetical protein
MTSKTFERDLSKGVCVASLKNGVKNGKADDAVDSVLIDFI